MRALGKEVPRPSPMADPSSVHLNISPRHTYIPLELPVKPALRIETARCRVHKTVYEACGTSQ